MDDDGDDKDDSKRRNRNLSEKKRRDQFNMLVNELSIMVSTNSRKMDKSTVLKATISFLKNHNDIKARSRAHDVHGDWKPTFLTNEEFTYLVLEALEGFVMVFSAIGRVHYVSESVASLLGHNPDEDSTNKPVRAAALKSYLYRRSGTGYTQQWDPTRRGDYYVELRVSNCRELEGLTEDLYKHSIISLKAAVKENSPLWRATSQLVVAAKEDFKGIQPILYSRKNAKNF